MNDWSLHWMRIRVSVRWLWDFETSRSRYRLHGKCRTRPTWALSNGTVSETIHHLRSHKTPGPRLPAPSHSTASFAPSKTLESTNLGSINSRLETQSWNAKSPHFSASSSPPMSLIACHTPYPRSESWTGVRSTASLPPNTMDSCSDPKGGQTLSSSPAAKRGQKFAIRVACSCCGGVRVWRRTFQMYTFSSEWWARPFHSLA